MSYVKTQLHTGRLTINQDFMKMFCIKLQLNKEELISLEMNKYQKEFWSEVFCFEKYETKTRKFAYVIKTDGYDVCIKMMKL